MASGVFASISSCSAAIRAIVLRFITAEMPRLENLGLPDILRDLAMLKRGLVLMVGATGSGKSTTLAAMINYRNENASDHIVMIEDPIEFLHTNKRSIVNQREVGLDTRTFEGALRASSTRRFFSICRSICARSWASAWSSPKTANGWRRFKS
jgi:Tfp pilus assembly ATPase PilU